MAMIFPLMVFIAVIYFTSKMAGRSEFIAILAGGVRYNRILRPYAGGGGVFIFTLLAGQSVLIPKANEIRTDFQAVYVDRNSSYNSDPYRNNNYYLRVDPNTFVGFRYYDTANKVGSNFFLQRLHGNKVYYNARAESVRWDPNKKDWRLSTVVERTIDGAKETLTKKGQYAYEPECAAQRACGGTII